MPLLSTGRSSITATGLPTHGWSVVWISFATILPWTVVAVFDAIDASYRRIRIVILRLLLSTACNAVAYFIGIWFVTEVVMNTNKRNAENGCSTDRTKCDFDRFDEISTFSVLLFFNLWFVIRNIRGWVQLFSLYRLLPLFQHMQSFIADASAEPINQTSITGSSISQPHQKYPSHLVTKTERVIQQEPLKEGIRLMRISDRLINNDLETKTPLLNPFGSPNEDWAIAAWRAWWTQECHEAVSLEASSHYDIRPSSLLAQDLTPEGPRWPNAVEAVVKNPVNGRVIERGDREAWIDALTQYGSQGQQDTRSPPMKEMFSCADRSGVATLVHEKTHVPPHRMSSLWYSTARFEGLYAEVASEIHARRPEMHIPACFSLWKELATDIARYLPKQMYLSGDPLCSYAGELASATLLLTRHAYDYRHLVECIYQDGRGSRWTFGWSGLLSCYSNLWTRQRIFIAMLNGLSLLSIRSAGSVSEIDVHVRCMLVGYASFAVSDRAVGKRIAELRKDELLRRYRGNIGRTCRGVGLCATREACRILGIPAEASHLDGLPAFCTGWAMEYLSAMPGNQSPGHGATHNEIEELEGSSNAWRYPDSKV